MFKNVSIIGVTNEEQTCKFSLICSFGDKMVTHLVWFYLFTYSIKFFAYEIRCVGILDWSLHTITISMVGSEALNSLES